ncbi:MAG: CotH kinase family protein [Verrucomicrobiales bacterium]
MISELRGQCWKRPGLWVSLLAALPALGNDPPLANPAPRLTEILCENRGGLRDADGGTPDWIEIHNPGPTAVDLSGWYLSDTPAVLTKWRFQGSTVLRPGEWRIVFASGKDRAGPGDERHTNFRLDPTGESVFLVAPDGRTVVSAMADYPNQRENVSFGIAQRWASAPVLDQASPVRWMVPGAEVNGWQDPDFDDNGWVPGVLGVGFDLGGETAGDGLLGWWPFDDPTVPTLAADASGHDRDGQVMRATYSADGQGRSDQAGDRSLVFSGTGVVAFPAVAAGAFDAMATRDAFTMSLWTFGAATMPQDHYLFYGSGGTNGTGSRLLDAHLPWSDSVIYFDTGGCCEHGQTRLLIGEPDASKWRGRWNHYVFLKNGDTKQIWQNGLLLHEGTNTANQPPLRSLFLGAQNASGTLGYRGRIDDFALWEGALDGPQIGALAAGARPPDVRRLTPLIATDVAAAMHGVNASVWLRIPFEVEDATLIDSLRLSVRYDDGCVAYLNGVEVARRHAPANLTATAAATAERRGGEALVAEAIEISTSTAPLRSGANVLAVHVLNSGVDDRELLFLPELVAGRTERDRFFPVPTPGQPNGLGVTGFVDPVRVDPPRGFFEAATDVTLICPTPGATIVFTTDGSLPTLENGTTGPSPLVVPIARTTPLRVSAFQGTLAPTRSETHTYLFVDQVASQRRPAGAPTSWPGGFAGDYTMDARVPGPAPAPGYSLRESLLSLPTLSLTTDPAGLWGAAAGIYSNASGRGHDWERFTSMEWLDPAGGSSVHAGTGLRIHGNISRNKDFTPKHSFSLRFRGDYGDPTLRFPLFPGSAVDSFDELVLRAGSTDTWPCTEWGPLALGLNGEMYQRWNRDWASYLRDQWVRDAHLDMGQEDFRGRFCHLYLNGSYWGLYNVTESPSASHMAAHLGGPEAEWDTVADFNELHEGTRDAWDQLLQMANGGQLSTNTGLRRVQGLAPDGTRDPLLPRLLDVDNLIDYMILHITIGADDWPDHNWWGARRSRGPDPEGFRFFAWDQEISNENVAYGRSSWGVVFAEANASGTPTRVYARLRSSPEFRLRFADQVHRHLFNDGALSESRNVARWQARVAEIDQAVVAESARWGDAQPNHTRPGQPYTRDNAWLPHLEWMATQYWPRHQAVALARFRTAGLYPAVAAPRLTPHGGQVPTTGSIAVTDLNPTPGTLYFTLTGDDPRQWGGAIHPSARSATGQTEITVPAASVVKARVRQGTTWSALAEASFVVDLDADDDGLDDSWELAHGLSPIDPTDAEGDADGDGASARHEFTAGTDPRDPTSILRLEVDPGDPTPGLLRLRFLAQPDRSYRLEYASTLTDASAWTELAGFGPVSAPTMIQYPASITSAPAFFRLRVGRK